MQDNPQGSTPRKQEPSLAVPEQARKSKYVIPRLVKYGSFPKLTQGMNPGVGEGGAMSPCL
jgi:hypothetical protein